MQGLIMKSGERISTLPLELGRVGQPKAVNPPTLAGTTLSLGALTDGVAGSLLPAMHSGALKSCASARARAGWGLQKAPAWGDAMATTPRGERSHSDRA